MARSKNYRFPPVIQAFINTKNVMHAVILRDMRTRFFNHGLGFIIVPLWPLVHMGVLITIHAVSGRAAPPYGESTALFYATGLVPTLTFMYVSRFMGYSAIQNKPMMAFPVVKALDVMFGRAFLEIIASCITITLITTILWSADQHPWPFDVENAVSAYLATIFLAIGCGTVAGVLSLAQPMVMTGYQLLIICTYLSSGTMFIASNLPDEVSYPLSFNPVLVCVEWMRTAYYETYSDKLIDKPYVLGFALGSLFLGLMIEKIFRRKLREG